MFEEFGSLYRSMRTYLFGRGLISLGVIAATMVGSAMGFATAAPALVLAIGGTVLTGMLRLNAQANYEQAMVDLYRDDIAQRQGIEPKDVTRANLKEAAHSNDIIAQALHRQERKNFVSFATATVAGLATFGLITFGLAPGLLTDFLTTHMTLGPTAANIVSFASTGIVATAASLVLHDGLEAAIGHGTGLHKAAAQDLIFKMSRELAIGHTVTPERVYGVLVAGDPSLQEVILQQFKKPYSDMTPREQREVVKIVGVSTQMQNLADDITNGEMHPGHLAFIIGDARILPPPRVSKLVQHVPALAHAPFVEKMGLAPRADGSFAERVTAARDNVTQLPAI